MTDHLTAYSVHVIGHPRLVSVTNIYCIGRNYAEHARELGNAVPTEPILFLKSVSSLRGLAGGVLAYEDETFHHEAELVLLVGQVVPRGSSVGWEVLQAVGLGIDLTRREVQSQLKAQGLPWTAAKSFAGSSLLSALIEPSELPDHNSIKFTFSVDGQLRQQGDTALMLNSVPTLLTHIAKANDLVPGDLVYTGTPAGVGPLRRGDPFTLAFTQIAKSFDGRL